MSDQADLLRQLVREAAVEFAPPESSRRLIVVCSGKGGVGTTTVAVQLAAALAALGRHSVLVDADLGRADATSLCGLAPTRGLADLLSGLVDAEALIVKHSEGMSVLPAAWAPSQPCEPSATAGRRLAAELARLADTVGWVVVDAGRERTPLHDRLWQAASHVLLVTTPDSLAVMDTYARIKSQCGDGGLAHVGVVITRAGRDAMAADAYARLEQACRRFLGLALEACGQIPECPALAGADGPLQSLPACEPVVTRSFGHLARHYLDTESTTRLNCRTRSADTEGRCQRALARQTVRPG